MKEKKNTAQKFEEEALDTVKSARGFAKEFREFITQGRVMDMAVGVIIGGAFGKIITSLVNNIIMPLIGLLFGSGRFDTLSVTLREASAPDAGDALVFGYGAFLQNVVDFLLIAFCIFLMIKTIAGLRARFNAAAVAKEKAEAQKQEAEKKALSARQEKLEEAQLKTAALLEEIRDRLAKT